MGIIDKAIGKVLDKVPLNKAIGEIPVLKTIKWAYDAGKAGYKIGTYIDKKTGASDKIGKGAFNTIGPASKGLIDKVDKISGMIDKGKSYYNKGTQMYQNAVDKVKSMAGLSQSGVLTRNTTGAKTQGSFIGSALNKATIPIPTAQKNIQAKTGAVKQIKSIKPGGANPVKTIKSASPSPSRTTFNPGNNKMFSIKQQASGSKFNPMKSKAFTIKQQPAKTKFNLATSKAFTIKTLGTTVKKFTPPKMKTFTPAKSIGLPKTNFSKPAVKSSFSLKPMNRPVSFNRPINRPVMKSVPFKK